MSTRTPQRRSTRRQHFCSACDELTAIPIGSSLCDDCARDFPLFGYTRRDRTPAAGRTQW